MTAGTARLFGVGVLSHLMGRHYPGTYESK